VVNSPTKNGRFTDSQSQYQGLQYADKSIKETSMKARLSYSCCEIEREYGTFSNGLRGFYLNFNQLCQEMEFNLPGSLHNLKIGLECSNWVDVCPDEESFFRKLEDFEENYSYIQFDYPRFWDGLPMSESGDNGSCDCYLDDGKKYDAESGELEFENDGELEVILTEAIQKPDSFTIVYDDGEEEEFTDKDLFLKKVEALCKELESKK
jgi:hypothetical protein